MVPKALVGRNGGAVGIDVDDLVDGWKGALRAVFARARAAAGADGGGRGEVGEIEPLGVDGAVGVAGFAA